MGVVDGELAAYGHHEPSPDDREIERFPVVRGAGPERLDLFLESGDECPLRTEIEEQVLPEDQLLPGEMSDADEEDVRSRAAREPRRLRIEEQHVLPSVRWSALQSEVRKQ